MIYRLYINDQEVNLNPGQVIATTLQASAIGSGDIINRRASYTNALTVPKTGNNIAVLGWCNMYNSSSTFTYQKNTCRITANGIEVLSGIVIATNFNTQFFLQIYSLEKDLSLAIGDAVLFDLDFGDSPITWDASYWDSRRNATSGLCAPVINYGQIDKTLADGTIGSFYLPSVSYKDIVTQIFTEAGYTVSGDFYDNNTDFNNMVMTYSRKDWPGSSFKINEILSSTMKQSTLLADLLVKFNAVFSVSGTDVQIKCLGTILGDPATGAVDWTAKRANRFENLIFTWDGWAQNNNFKYQDRQFKSDVASFHPSSYYWEEYNGALVSGDQNAAISRDVYTSPFYGDEYVKSNDSLGDASSKGKIFYRIGNVAQFIEGATFPVWDALPTQYEFDNEPVPMLCVLRDPDATEGVSIIYDGNVRTDYKIATFAIPYSSTVTSSIINFKWNSRAFSATRPGLLEKYYGPIQSILTGGAKTIERQYKLNDMDIRSIDLLTPVFDKDSYFFINKIKEYVSGRLTNVELLKI